jgi:hypothetical protein
MRLTAFVYSCLLVVLLLTVPAMGIALRAGQEVLVSKGQIIDDDLVATGSRVVIDGTVKGDVFAFAGDVIVSGRVEGEVFAFAGSVTIKDTVTGPLRAFGGSIDLPGTILGNITVFGGKVNLSGKAARDATLKCGQAAITGSVGRDLSLESNKTVVSGSVGRDAFLRSDALDLGPALAIGRDLDYRTPEKMSLPAGVLVAGQTAWKQLEVKKGRRPGGRGFRGFLVFIRVMLFLSALVVGFILLGISKKQCRLITDAAYAGFWKSLGLGVLWLLLTPGAIVLLLVTLIGWPLALFLAVVYLITLYLAGIMFGMMVGRKLFEALKKPEASPYLTFLAGMVIASFLMTIPFLGFLVKLFALLLGGGALVLSRYQMFRDLRKAGTI